MPLTDFEEALQTTDQIELVTTGRHSGRQSSRPVWFVREGGKLYLLPLTGSDTQWYRNVLETPAISLTAGATEYHTQAEPLTSPAEVEQVVEAFRAKYGARNVESYFPKHDVAVEVALA
jgi:hypothetical protein